MLKKIQKADGIVLLSVICFLVYKLIHLSFRFGDGDVYWYMVQSMLHHVWPYRDFFLSDPPVFLLFLAALKPLLRSHWLWYQALPIFLEVANAIVLYFVLRPKIKLAWLAPLLYLFSFTELSTSDFSTGVQLTVFFSLLGWLYAERENLVLSGIAWTLSILTKLYALPAFLGFIGLRIYNKQSWLKLCLMALATGSIILLPFFLASPHGFINSIIITQFHRPPGTDRGSVWVYFFKREWVLILLGLMGAMLKANRKYLPAFLLSVLFFALFKDLYYLYLAYFFPLLVIFVVTLFDQLWRDLEIRPLAVVVILLLTWSMVGGVLSYQNSVLAKGRFLNVQEIADYLKTLDGHAEIYGSHELAPVLSLYSGKPIFGNYIDTNSQAFAAGTLGLDTVSQQATTRGVYLVGRITDWPQYGIKEQGFEGYFSRPIFDKNCKRLKFFDSTSQESDNYIGIYDCHD